jgi:hypothetical protein
VDLLGDCPGLPGQIRLAEHLEHTLPGAAIATLNGPSGRIRRPTPRSTHSRPLTTPT